MARHRNGALGALGALCVALSALAAPAAGDAATALAPLAAHAAGRWGRTVDGVMGGRSSLDVDTSSNGVGVHMSGVLNTHGGGFVYASASLGEVDARGYEGVVVHARALSPGSAPLTLTLYVDDGSSSPYEFAHPFTLPAGVDSEEREAVTFFLPFEKMEGRVWWRDSPCESCSLDLSRLRKIKVYLLFQSGDFDCVIEDVQLARSEDDAPPRTQLSERLHTSEDVRAVTSAAIGVGAPLYDKGYQFECYSHYAEAAWALLDASGPAERIKTLMRTGLANAARESTPARAAWRLRWAFDDMRCVDPAHDGSAPASPTPATEAVPAGAMGSVDDDGCDPDPIDLSESADMHLEVLEAIYGAIHEGVPRYNHGDIEGCADVYLETAEMVVAALAPVLQNGGKMRVRGGALGAVHSLFHEVVERVRASPNAHDDNAWAIRHVFNASIDKLQSCRWHTCEETWEMEDAPAIVSPPLALEPSEAEEAEPSKFASPPPVATAVASAGAGTTLSTPGIDPADSQLAMVSAGDNLEAVHHSDASSAGDSSSIKGHDTTVLAAAVAGAVAVGVAATVGVGVLVLRSRRGHGGSGGMAIGLPVLGGSPDNSVPMTAVIVSNFKSEKF